MHWRWISLAALLAALTIGYSAFNDRRSAPRLAEAEPPQPGYYLRDAVITQTQADGSLSARLVVNRIEQRSEATGISLEAVRLNYFRAPGREWLLTSKTGYAPAASSVITFRGDVMLHPVDAENASMRTQALAVDVERNIAYAVDTPATIEFGAHSMIVRNFSADLASEKIQMEAVNGRFTSK